jgi:hypothetical protein
MLITANENLDVMERKRLVVAAALLGALMFVSGVLSYQYLIASPNNGHNEKFVIEGHGVIMAYHADGTLFATWKGDNTLTGQGLNVLTSCLGNLTTTPVYYKACVPVVTEIAIGPSSGLGSGIAPATNTGLPAGCNPNTATPSYCSGGWVSTATFDCLTTNPTCTATLPVTINNADGGATPPGCGCSFFSFDDLSVSPGITMNAGDRLIVTITYTIT